MKIRPSKKQQFHDVGHYVRIAFLGLGQPGAQGQPGGPRETKKIRPSKKQQFHDVGHYVRIAFWGLGQPGAQGQPGGPRETMKIRPSKKQQSHDVGHHVRIAFLGLGQPEPVRSSHEQPRAAIGNPKTSDLAESVRKNIIRQTSPQQKKWRMYNAGY